MEQGLLINEVLDNDNLDDDEKEDRKKQIEADMKAKYERKIITGVNKDEFDVIRDDMFIKHSLEEIYALMAAEKGENS